MENYTLEQGLCVCGENNIKYEGNCYKSCEEKQYLDFVSETCKECYFYQDTCVEECPSDTILKDRTCNSIYSLNIVTMIIIGVVAFFVIVCYLIFHKRSSKKVHNITEIS